MEPQPSSDWVEAHGNQGSHGTLGPQVSLDAGFHQSLDRPAFFMHAISREYLGTAIAQS